MKAGVLGMVFLLLGLMSAMHAASCYVRQKE